MQNGVGFAGFSSATYAKARKLGVVKLLSVPKIGQMSQSGTFPE